MDYLEAIGRLRSIRFFLDDDNKKAIDMAIESLEENGYKSKTKANHNDDFIKWLTTTMIL